MLKVLELFSGTGSIGKVCKELGYEVLSLDNELPADINIDIMDWDYKQYKPGDFDIIWASPPCTFYSNLQNCWIGRPKKDGTILTKELLEEKRKESDLLVERTLDIIDYFKPDLWFMENPKSGQLKDRDIVKDLPFYDVDYCMYSDWGYKKPTRIWTNKENFNNKLCNGNCGNLIENTTKHKTNLASNQNIIVDGKIKKINTKKDRLKHKVSLDKVGSGSQLNQNKDMKYLGKGTNRIDRYRIPPDLIYSLFLD